MTDLDNYTDDMAALDWFLSTPDARAVCLGRLQSRIYHHLEYCDIAMQTSQEIITAVCGMNKPQRIKDQRGRVVMASTQYARQYHAASNNVRRALNAMVKRELVGCCYNARDTRAMLRWSTGRENEIPGSGKIMEN